MLITSVHAISNLFLSLNMPFMTAIIRSNKPFSTDFLSLSQVGKIFLHFLDVSHYNAHIQSCFLKMFYLMLWSSEGQVTMVELGISRIAIIDSS